MSGETQGDVRIMIGFLSLPLISPTETWPARQYEGGMVQGLLTELARDIKLNLEIFHISLTGREE
jgi:hypothetical protein